MHLKITFSSCCFSGQILTFVARVASLHFHLIFFGSYLLFGSCPLKQPFCNSKTKFYLVNSSTLEILSIALMSNRRKEWENFVLKFFHRERRNTKQRNIEEWQCHKLGDVYASLFLNNSSV